MKSNKTTLLMLILSLVAGCHGGGGGGAAPPAPTLVSVAVTPSNPSVALGIMEPFKATGTYSDGSIRDATTSVNWGSSDTAVATINSNGVATSLTTGSTIITAASGSVSDTATLTVVAKTLVSIEVTAAFLSMPTTTTEQFFATGTYSDNTTADLITTSVTWTSTIPAVATVDSNGLVTSVAAGTTLIEARSGNASGSALLTVGTPTVAANNVLPIFVNDGTICLNSYPNKPCASVTVCTPGSLGAENCQVINDIILDTGSYGLRIFKQAFTNATLLASLTQVSAGSGSLATCVQFGDGSSEWGPVELADVNLGNETAQRVPIQVIDSTFASLPTACQNADASPAPAGFHGILGVGLFAQDCGSFCANPANADNGLYYSCSGSTCAGTSVSVVDQVSNPVALLPAPYNNGVIVELPSVPSTGSPSVSGILVLGIPTNNAPSGVTTYKTNLMTGDIVTILNGVSYPGVIDSGSNGLFFTAPSNGLLPDCTLHPGWFCPSILTTLSATNENASLSVSSDVFFQIGNFDTLTNSSNMVFSNIGASTPNMFNWGLPFYLGRSVYVGIAGKNSSLGTGPYFAY